MGETSLAEVAARVIAGLIDVAAVRQEAMAPLAEVVATAVGELDPDGLRVTDPTWTEWAMRPWARLDAFDRLRKAYEDLVVLEAQASEVVSELRSLLTPRPVVSVRRPMVMSPRRAHRLLSAMAERRVVYLKQMENAERRVRPRLTPGTSKGLRRALREISAEEARGGRHRERLGLLLSMGDLIAS